VVEVELWIEAGAFLVISLYSTTELDAKPLSENVIVKWKKCNHDINWWSYSLLKTETGKALESKSGK
jgi:hypothetical protein